ncbi:MAG: UDP-N-acetylglucosamine--N-acetylmuramyl-(pentapeptide) pyrophosphoryl-undecaprenol N-acetylglucosamine transferase, partial [Muribaculaceae bacterium]|nr:UDP-N-acetylglucosamine--N-acetylmuramyl-(pentapeptide) pyrophosphoryl-undecaprenol N-acetylglucosamine transferase [Muribaculaceae bacterium]
GLCIPAVLVPSPNVAEDHQTKNALALANRGAAILIPDNEAQQKLADTLISLIGDPARLNAMKQAISEMALPDADEKIVDEIIRIINHS